MAREIRGIQPKKDLAEHPDLLLARSMSKTESKQESTLDEMPFFVTGMIVICGVEFERACGASSGQPCVDLCHDVCLPFASPQSLLCCQCLSELIMVERRLRATRPGK